jgi:hypothetical protein
MGQDARSKATDLPDGASVFLATAEVTRGMGLNRLAISVFRRTQFERCESTREDVSEANRTDLPRQANQFDIT